MDMFFAFPGPAFSNSLGEQVSILAQAQIPMDSRCYGFAGPCPQPLVMPAVGPLSNSFKVPFADLLAGYTFPTVINPVDGEEAPWSGETVTLDPFAPFRSYFDHLMDEPDGIETVTLKEAFETITEFGRVVFDSFWPFVQGSTVWDLRYSVAAPLLLALAEPVFGLSDPTATPWPEDGLAVWPTIPTLVKWADEWFEAEPGRPEQFRLISNAVDWADNFFDSMNNGEPYLHDPSDTPSEADAGDAEAEVEANAINAGYSESDSSDEDALTEDDGAVDEEQRTPLSRLAASVKTESAGAESAEAESAEDAVDDEAPTDDADDAEPADADESGAETIESTGATKDGNKAEPRRFGKTGSSAPGRLAGSVQSAGDRVRSAISKVTDGFSRSSDGSDTDADAKSGAGAAVGAKSGAAANAG